MGGGRRGATSSALQTCVPFVGGAPGAGDADNRPRVHASLSCCTGVHLPAWCAGWGRCVPTRPRAHLGGPSTSTSSQSDRWQGYARIPRCGATGAHILISCDMTGRSVLGGVRPGPRHPQERQTPLIPSTCGNVLGFRTGFYPPYGVLPAAAPRG
eukprot:332218-Prymnesium_polylepis.2